MNDVIKFPSLASRTDAEKEDLVFVCNCSCQSFYIKDDHTECTNCGNVPSEDEMGAEWRRVLPPLPDDPSTLKDDGGAVTNRLVSDAVMAKKRFMRAVNECADNDTLAMLVSYSSDGSGKHWLSIDTDEQKKWVLRKLDEIRSYVENKKVEV